jgi:integrase
MCTTALRRFPGVAVSATGHRHFRAAWLISMGTDIAVVSKTLGHKSIAITSDIYGSLQEKAAKDLAEKTRGYISRRRPA